jgi:uncharacterized OsmC-like protein
MKKNNVDLSVLGGVLERAQQDPDVLKLHKRVEGTWNFAGGSPAFSATVVHGDASTQLHADIAPGFGGAGLAPDPLQYFLFGLGACYAATVITLASMEGVALAGVQVVAENHADVSRVYDLADKPLMELVTITVRVDCDADDATLDHWQQAAREKCPFAYSIINAIPLETTVERL